MKVENALASQLLDVCDRLDVRLASLRRRHSASTQGNYAFVFRGVGLAVWAGGVRRVNDAMFLDVARVLAHMVSLADLAQGASGQPR
jgi:malic enzyme